MRKQWITAVGLVMLTAACGGQYATTQAGTTPSSPAKASEPKALKDTGMDLRRAALPFKILRSDGGQEVAPDLFFDDLASAAGICLGETHPDPHHHWAQLRMFEEVVTRRNASKMALGMEMFQRPFQGVLNDYGAGRIDEAAMLSRTDWANRWGYDFALYRPLLALAVKREIPILGLNISKELKDKIKRRGVDGLTEKDQAKVPEVDVDDADHKAWFEDLMAEMGGGGHGHGGGHSGNKDAEEMARKIYFSQVLWDETMADTATRWLGEQPERHVVIIAGSGHCHESAIARRMRRRGAGRIISVRPVIQGKEARELANPQTDYLFVLIRPTAP